MAGRAAMPGAGGVRPGGRAIAMVLAVLAFGACPARAAAQGVPSASVSAAALGGSVNTFTWCDGQREVQANAAFLKVDRGAHTSGETSVEVTYGGTLTPGIDYPALPDPVVIEAGETFTILEVRATAAGSVTLTVDAGVGYDVGDPAMATAVVTDIPLVATCHGVVAQTIGVGTRPTFLDPSTLTSFGGAIYDTLFSLTGELPAGMSSTTGQIVGVATTPGVYEFVERWCFGGDRCVLEVPYRITVVSAQRDGPKVTPPPPSPAKVAAPAATAATPVRTDATFTG